MLKLFILDLVDYFKYKLDYSALVHRLCCVFSGLTIVYYLLMCIFSFSGALDDMEIYKNLGFSFSFGHHLLENDFLEVMQEFLPIAVEFFLYVILSHCAENNKFQRIAIWYFGVIALLHMLVFSHAVSLDFPESPPYVTADGISLRYYLFARTTLLQSAVYLIAYLLRVKKMRSIEQ